MPLSFWRYPLSNLPYGGFYVQLKSWIGKLFDELVGHILNAFSVKSLPEFVLYPTHDIPGCGQARWYDDDDMMNWIILRWSQSREGYPTNLRARYGTVVQMRASLFLCHANKSVGRSYVMQGPRDSGLRVSTHYA